MNEAPRLVMEVAFVVQGRNRDECIDYADQLGNQMLGMIGGEPWVMQDDDWKRIVPQERLTIVDSNGYMYTGLRRYQFRGPLVGQTNVPEHDGFRTQHGGSEASQEHQ